MNFPLLKNIDHIAIAVLDLDEAIRLFQEIFGVDFRWRTRNEAEGFEAAAFYLDDFHVEFLSPTRADSNISAFLAKRGNGIHHIAFATDCIESSMETVAAKGATLVNHEAQTGTGRSKIAFIHPKSLLGVLVELVQPAEEVR